MQKLLDDKVLFSLVVIVSLLVMILAKSAFGVLGLVCLIAVKLEFRRYLDHVRHSKELVEKDRVNAIEIEVRQLSNAITFKNMSR